MSISSVNSVSHAAHVHKSQTLQAPDGDRKVASANTSQTKDADGDYKVLRGAAGTSSTGVLESLGKLKKGG